MLIRKAASPPTAKARDPAFVLRVRPRFPLQSLKRIDMGKSPHSTDDQKEITRRRAGRRHQGPGHWHVERKGKDILCRPCGARIPRALKPAFCPECGAGKEETSTPE